MHRLIFLLYLLPIFLSADYEFLDEEDLCLCHHVNVISGHLNISCQDGVVRGAQTLPLNRTYTSAGALEREHGEYAIDLRKVRGNCLMQGGWSWFPHITLYIEPSKKRRDYRIYIPEKSGNFLRYRYTGRDGVYACFKPEYTGGQCSGSLSSRRNPGNNVLKIDLSERKAILYLPDGGTRTYVGLKDKSASLTTTSFLALVSERLPSGHQIIYRYNSQNQLYRVELRNPACNKVLAFAHVDFVKLDTSSTGHFHYRVSTSDGGVFDYRSVAYKEWHYLNSVKSNCRPEESSHYQPGRKGIGARMDSFILGGNEQIKVHYYGPTGKKEALKWKDGKKPRFEIDKVNFLEAPIGPNGKFLPFASFTYAPDVTDVRDTDNLLTRYHHDGQRLQLIEYFGKEDKLHSSLKLLWQGTHLVAKTLLDTNQNALFSRTFAYDESGNVIQETFWGNLTGTLSGPFSMDETGRLPHAESYSKYYQYDPNSHLPLVEEEEEGLTYRYTYLSGTDLITTKMTCKGDQILMRQVFQYDPDHLLVAEIVDDGGLEQKIKRHERNPKTGLIIATNELYCDQGKEVLLKRSEYRYSPQNQIIEEAVYDANNIYRYTLKSDYDRYGNLILKTTPLGQTNIYSYDENGNLVESKEVGSLHKIYTYTRSGKPTSCREIDDTGNSKTTHSHYDPKGRLLAQTDVRGNPTHQTYDEFGRCLSTQFPSLECGTIPLVHYTYDDLGNVASMTTPLGDCVRTTYNSLRKPLRISQADGTELIHTYTKQGLLTQTVYPDQTRDVLTYDSFQRITAKITYAADGEVLAQEHWEYNSFHLLAHTDTRGLTTYFTYDSAGRQIAETAEDRQTTYTYDALGFIETTTTGPTRHVQLHDVGGRVIEEWLEDEMGTCENRMQFFYDENNRKIKAHRLTANGKSVDLFFYDGEGRLSKHIDPLGAISQWLYTDVVNTAQQTVLQKISIDPLGNRSIETYDALQHLVQLEKKDPEGNTVSQDQYSYNASGNQVKRTSTLYQKHTPLKTITTTWEYDSMGRVIKEVEADQKTTLSRYDSCGRLAERTLPSGTILTYLYDGIDRLTELYSSDRTIHYQYIYRHGPDPTTIIDYIHNFRIQRDYNPFGQLLHEIGPQGFTYTWSYDHHGRRTRFTLPSHDTVAYAYCGTHLTSISRLTPNGDSLYTHHYTQFDPNGHVQQELLLNNLATITTQRDLLERPIAQTSSYLQLGATYNPSGLIVQISSSLFGTKHYGYDPLNQLTAEGEKSHSFDSLGNPTQWEVNDCNQILKSDDSTFKYDPDGNLISRITQKGETQFHYDALGRLTDLITPQKKIHYTYDPCSRLLSKKINDQDTVFYLYDEEHEIGTATAQGALLQLKVLGLGIQGDIGGAVAIELNQNIFAPLHDFSGNIIALISTQGNLTEATDIDAFGRNLHRASPNPWQFCSKRLEENLIFFGKRFYDPPLGRFLTPDPLGALDSPNLYLYVRNNPLNRLDLFGLFSEVTSPIPFNIEVPITFPQIQSLLAGNALPIRGAIDGVKVDFVISCKQIHQLQFSEEELKAGKVNIFDHLGGIVPKDGSLIGIATWQNGMNVSRREFEKMSNNIIKQLPDGVFGLGIYNPTQTVPGDLLRVGVEFLHEDTPTILRTRQLMNCLIDTLPNINPEVIWLHICHSEAGLISKRSIRGMTDERRQKMREHVVVVGLGPARPLSDRHVKRALNFYSDKDNITKRFAMKYLQRPEYNIQIVPCLTSSKDRDFIAGDHGFFKDTYQHHLGKSIEGLGTTYGFYKTR